MNENIKRDWYILDCDKLIVGRVSTLIATILMGKYKTKFSKEKDTGDFIILLNVDKIIFTGNKNSDKKYWKHSGYIGSINYRTPNYYRSKNLCKNIMINSVNGMLPKNKNRKRMINRLKCYNGSVHPHSCQNPIVFDYKNFLFK